MISGSTSDSALKVPQLAPPGAGLPWIELQIARLLFSRAAARATPESSARLLADESAEVLVLAQCCDEAAGIRRVLIKRLPGMEDSSRFWSIYMTLDHLRIVNLAIAHAIKQLGQGLVPEQAANTAGVKPGASVDSSVIADFKLSCRLIAREVQQLSTLKTKVRYSHPWFGPLDAADWYFLAGYHIQLHRKQILSILKQLRRERPF